MKNARFFVMSFALVLFPSAVFSAGHDLSPSGLDRNAFGADSAQIAWNGSEYLALWQTNGAIFGTFISAAGTVLNTPALTFPQIPQPSGGPMQLAALGRDFLLVLPSSPPHTALIRSDGSVSVDQPKLELPQVMEISLAVNGDAILITSASTKTAYFLATTGTLERAVPLGDQAYAAKAAAWRDGFVIVTTNSSGLTISRFDAVGTATAAAERIPSSGAFRLESASSDEAVLVAWSEGNEPRTRGRAARITDRAQVVDLPALPISAAWTGSSYLLGTSDGLLTISREGAVLRSAGSVASSAIELAGHDDTAFAILSACCGGAIDGTSIALTPSIHSREAIPLDLAPHAQSQPLIASNGVDFFTTWTDAVWLHADVSAVTVDRNGAPSRAPATVAQVTSTAKRRLAFSGSTYLSIQADTQLLGQRFTSTGEPIDASPFVIRGEAIYASTITRGAQGFLVAWIDAHGLWATTVGEDGSVATPRAIPIDAKYFPPSQIAAAFDGSQFLLVYAARPAVIDAFPPYDYAVDAIRLRADLTPIDSDPLLLDAATRHISVASNGRDICVVSDRRGYVVALTIDAKEPLLRVASTTTLLPWFDSDVTSDIQSAGSDYVIATRHRVVIADSSQHLLSLIRLTDDGSLRPRRTIRIQPPADEGPSLATNSLGDVVTVIGEYPGRVDSVRARSYAESEMPVVTPPSPPALTSFTHTGRQYELTWTANGPDPEAFVIESSRDDVIWVTRRVVAGSARSATFDDSIFDPIVRLRALNGSVLSERALPPTQPRRRSVR